MTLTPIDAALGLPVPAVQPNRWTGYRARAATIRPAMLRLVLTRESTIRIIDCMVSRHQFTRSSIAPALPVAGALVRTYLIVIAVTLATLVVLSFTAPSLATANAWGHAIVVAVFAIVLPPRLRRAQTGERGAVRAVGLISAVLLLVNVVEALIPGFVPVWMKADLVLVALLMAGVVIDVARWAVMKKD